jgi:hypothetical protein
VDLIVVSGISARLKRFGLTYSVPALSHLFRMDEGVIRTNLLKARKHAVSLMRVAME